MKLSFCIILLLVVHLGSSWEIDRARYPHKLSQTDLSTNKPQQDFTVNIMIHIDKELTKKISKQGPKTRRKIKLFIRETISDVDKIFRNISMSQKLSFKLLNTKFLRNRTDIVTADENSSKYLKSYCTWQSKKKEHDWFYSVLLTGLDLYRLDDKGKKLRKSTGLSYIRGMCSVGHSCAIVEWNPDSIAYLIAHEIAHSIGISHDGRPYNPACKPKGHMMGSKYKAKSHPWTWSVCSMRAFKTYLASEQAWCLKPDYVNNLTTR